MRPNLSECCSKLGQCAHNPGLEHASSLHRVFPYLKGMIDLSLKYQIPNPTIGVEIHSLGFLGFIDVVYVDNPEDLKSTSRYIFKLVGGPISWRSRKQTITATSSTKVEYVGYSLASKEAIWLCLLLKDLGYIVADTHQVTLYGGNMSAISLTGSTDHHERTKHIDIHQHYVREQVKNGLIRIKYVNTKDMPADGLTKPLQGAKFLRFLELLGLYSPTRSIS